MDKIYHPLLALIASAADNELAKYVEYLKHENKIFRARIPGQIHTTYEERQTLMKFGKAVGHLFPGQEAKTVGRVRQMLLEPPRSYGYPRQVTKRQRLRRARSVWRSK